MQTKINRTIQIPQAHWHRLQDINADRLQQTSGGSWEDREHLILPVLDREYRINPAHQRIETLTDAAWLEAPPFPAFVTVVYLINSEETVLSGNWISEKDLSCASFFYGVHRLPVEELLHRFSRDPASFTGAVAALGGVATDDPGDASVRLWVFPRVPVKLMLWCEDEMLPASMSVLFDESIEKLLPADGIWAMVGLVSDMIIEAADRTDNF